MSVYYWRLLGNLMKAEDKVQLAELSHQCGVEDGRKEVVEWVYENAWRDSHIIEIEHPKWQAQLKEWGIER